MKITINTPVTIDGVSYTAGQVVEFATQALYEQFLAKFDEAITPAADKGVRTRITEIQAALQRCEELYILLLARQLKAGLLSENATKQRSVDTATAVFSVPLKQGRVVAAAFAIRGVTQATITANEPYITAEGLLALRNELHDIVGLPHVLTYNA